MVQRGSRTGASDTRLATSPGNRLTKTVEVVVSKVSALSATTISLVCCTDHILCVTLNIVQCVLYIPPLIVCVAVFRVYSTSSTVHCAVVLYMHSMLSTRASLHCIFFGTVKHMRRQVRHTQYSMVRLCVVLYCTGNSVHNAAHITP